MTARPRMAVVLAVALSGCFWGDGPDDSPEPLQPGPPLRLVWSLMGAWSGIATPPGSDVAYASRSGELFFVRLRDGAETAAGRKVELRLRAGVRKGQPILVSFNPWGYGVHAHTVEGEPLWSYEAGDAIDDVWPVDLTGDADTETIMGLNGDGGVLALDSAGREIWSNRTIGNVWHVTAGPLDGRQLRVLTTSAGGGVHVFSTGGEPIRDLAARVYATEIRFADQPIVAGSGDGASFVATVDPSGWMTKVSERTTATSSLAAHPSVPWIAVSTITGNVYALRASTGAIEGAASGVGRGAEVEWADVGGSPLLLVAGNAGLKAYRVGERPAPSPRRSP